MSLDLVYEIWKSVKPSIETGDINEASEVLVNVLLENNFDTSEIKTMFKRDKAVQKAINFYTEKPEDGLYHETSVNHYDDDDEDYENDDG